MSTRKFDKDFQAAAIRDVYLAILDQEGIDEKVFLQMVAESDALAAVKSLLKPGGAQTGFRGLRKRGRADLTVEHLAIQPEWRGRFTDLELKTAKSRLQRNTPRKSISHDCSAKKECPLYHKKAG